MVSGSGSGASGGGAATSGTGAGGSSGSGASGVGGAGAGDGAGGTGTVGPGGSAVTNELDACLLYFDTICDRLVACGAFAREDCALRSEVCPDRLFSEGSGWTIERAQQCTAEWLSFDCESVKRLRMPDCAKVTGSFDDDAPCIADDQCKSGACNAAFVFTGECGTCVPVLPTDSACDPTSAATAECPVDQYCDAATSACLDHEPRSPIMLAAPRGLGEPCTSSSNCEEGLACQANAPDAADGSCVAAPPLGSPCLYDLGDIGQCAAGATCPNPDGAICQPLGQLNDDCGWALCVEGLYCNTIGDDFGTSHTCLEPRKAGEPCVRNTAFERETSVCEAGLDCMYVSDTRTEARCALRRDRGESCDGVTEMCRPGMRCEASVCVAGESRGLYEATCL